MASENCKPPLTSSQLSIIFNDIASCASAIKRFAINQTQEDDHSDARDVEAMRHAIETLAERIGLLADRAAVALPDSLGAVVGATVEDWLMPPIYHRGSETSA